MSEMFGAAAIAHPAKRSPSSPEAVGLRLLPRRSASRFPTDCEKVHKYLAGSFATTVPGEPGKKGGRMGERRVDDEGYVWEYNNWTGNWEPVRDNWGNHVREGGGTWWGSERR